MRIKRLATLIIAAALWASAAAETYVGGHYAAGISTIYMLPHSNETWRITPYDMGFVYRYYADNERHKYFNIGIQAELNFAARRYRFGEKITTDVMIDSVNYRIDTLNKKIYSQVIELPIVMQWQFPITRNFRLYLNGLIYVAYYLKNEAFYLDPANGQNVTERFNYTQWNNFDFGIGGGLGVGYTIGSYEIGIDARFLMGISGLYPQEPSRYESMPQQILMSISLVKKIGLTK
jgi:hypothetical protein